MQGKISPVFSVHCGQCGTHATPRFPEHSTASLCGAWARGQGWKLTKYRGWVCPPCDAVGFAGGPAGALPPGTCDDWERATKGIETTEETNIDPGDWFWRDPEGRIRRAYGWLGGSYQRAHTFDAEGRWVCGVEVRDEEGVSQADLDDPAGVHPEWRAVVMTYPIEFTAPVAKE